MAHATLGTGALLAGLTLLCHPCAAQTVSFPMTQTARGTDSVTLANAPRAFESLAALRSVRLTGVPTPGGATLALDLERVAIHLAKDAIHVNGKPARDVGIALSLWRGKVVGMQGSQAFLALSPHGSRGWFGVPGRLLHLLAEPGPNRDWSVARIATDGYLDRAGFKRALSCKQLVAPGVVPVEPLRPAAPASSNPPLPFYDAPIAFETDYEFYRLFNNLKAAQTYAFSLIGAVSDRYREQIGVIFTLPYVGFHTTSNDPWSSTQCFGRLNEFRNAWRNGRAPKRAQLYHMISGVRVSGCGGVAYLNVLCNQSSGFGMSAHINGRLTFPPVVGPLTWDFFVIAHELGHNFAARHTHDYRPPIDQCASRRCINNGTIMSYCHTCSGGMRNITLRFHSRIVPVMRNAVVRSCLKPFDGVITDDLGFALAGSNGTPTQQVSFAKPSVRVVVGSAPKSRPGFLLIGARSIRIPFFGGTLVPQPDFPIPVLANASGDATVLLAANGSFRSGVTMYMHSWFLDPGGRNLVAATNATRVELIRP